MIASSRYFINRSVCIFFLVVFTITNVSAVAITNITQLTYANDTGYANPAWSPDGSKIAYNYILGNNYSIWIMDSNGSNKVPLTKVDNNKFALKGTRWIDRDPRWSPDGSKIVFERTIYNEEGGNEGHAIYIIYANGSNQKMLVGAAGSPVISPNGRYISFEAGIVGDIASTPEQGYGIYVIDIDGTNAKRLTNDYGDELTPSWSPDGKKIVFTKGGIDGTIHVMNADGSNMISTEQRGLYPRWSRDGKRIAFISERAGDMLQSIKLYHIYVMDTDGTNVTQLTFGDNRREWAFDWSPDSTKIIFDSRIPPSAKSNLYIMTLDFNAAPTPTPTVTQIPTATPVVTPTQTSPVPSFSLSTAFVSLLILVLIKRRKR